jgi:hypothetical protein
MSTSTVRNICVFLCTLGLWGNVARAELPALLTGESPDRLAEDTIPIEDGAAWGNENLLSRQLAWFNGPSLQSRFDADARPQLLMTQQSDVPGTSSSSANEDSGPDISTPGPDMGDFPSSSYTVGKGRLQLEMGPVSFRSRNSNNPSAYAWPYLIRYGVTDNVEFRLFGTGLTSLMAPNSMTGFGVVTFDTKIHLWNDQMEYFIPAASFEAALQTDLGSPAFRTGTQPSLSINMDFPFTRTTNFEATIAYSGNTSNLFLVNTTTSSDATPVPPTNHNVYQFSVLWALEQKLTERFKGFVHGYYSTPVGISGDAAVVVGAGFLYQLTRRSMLFGSADAGLTNVPAPFLTQVGLAYTF